MADQAEVFMRGTEAGGPAGESVLGPLGQCGRDLDGLRRLNRGLHQEDRGEADD